MSRGMAHDNLYGSKEHQIVYNICHFWKHPMSRIRDDCVFIQGNLKYSIRRPFVGL